MTDVVLEFIDHPSYILEINPVKRQQNYEWFYSLLIVLTHQSRCRKDKKTKKNNNKQNKQTKIKSKNKTKQNKKKKKKKKNKKKKPPSTMSQIAKMNDRDLIVSRSMS